MIVAGERQPAAVHAAVCALNTFLGNTGKTVSYYETKDAALPSVSSLASLVSAMKAGAIQTLVILGGNPVFDAPADLDFASAMAKVPHSIALGHTVDETSSKAEWHIPHAHYLESWGDARAVGGTLSVVQPLILPLFGGRTPVEVLGLMVGARIVRAMTSCGRPGSRSWARPSSTGSGTACCMTGSLPAASFPKSPRSQRGRLRGARPPSREALGEPGRPDLRRAWRSSSSPPRRFTTAVSRTTGGCRSFPIPSRSSPGTTPRS